MSFVAPEGKGIEEHGNPLCWDDCLFFCTRRERGIEEAVIGSMKGHHAESRSAGRRRRAGGAFMVAVVMGKKMGLEGECFEGVGGSISSRVGSRGGNRSSDVMRGPISCMPGDFCV